jgi:hypothetical protein
MSIHLHHTRQMAAWTLSAIVLSPLPLAFCFGSPPEAPKVELSPVTGRVTIAGQPIAGQTMGGVLLCLDQGTEHVAFGGIANDGTFHLNNMRHVEDGAEPGRYHGHLYSLAGDPKIPAKYQDPKTSGIELDIAPGPNDFRIDLP